eukprot:4352934-Amphidinium_carterae.2
MREPAVELELACFGATRGPCLRAEDDLLGTGGRAEPVQGRSPHQFIHSGSHLPKSCANER